VPLQAAGALAHLAALPGGALALVSSHHLVQQLGRLLGSPLDDVRLAAAMALCCVSGGGMAAARAVAAEGWLAQELLALLLQLHPQVRPAGTLACIVAQVRCN
jgi:HEAT repeat protein